ncbi:molybdopterin-synthase adenylyltransferase MoeB [Ornithinimicrobium sp. F0845]|uniref:molybdopterin-synthase adenylyltransferase MoeB n=1 Tax=Ornithinimicrobium sp. F0845 TaxID=2926412 RepID=UPI001FF1223F|nr:molybdopterin-synthase adenylyltransferase MoeB [Ornithinimicrobium sp. F0845]MCK0113185.1 molybdopterin-synthase adenylyltransferase MoeB [Ornithinimicrobium sp. F0845]
MADLVDPVDALSPDQLSRYSRHLLLPGIGLEGQKRLVNARVAIVGAGGLGSPALLYLAAAGVGHLTVIDDDEVDLTNLQRQVIHRVEDLGSPKVDSAIRAVRDLNPTVSVTGVRDHLDEGNAREVLAGHHLVLDGSDNFDTRYVVNDAAVALGIPLVWAAVLRFDAQITTFLPAAVAGEAAVQLRDLFPVPPRPEDVPSCAEAGVLGAMVGQVGSIMAAEAVKLITGTGEPLVGRVLLLDALTQRTREVPLRPRDAPEHDPQGAGRGWMPEAGESREVVAIPEMSPEEVRDQVDGLQVIDVREPGEHALGTVPGARTVPVGEVLTWDDLSQVRDQPVVFYCKVGPRAGRAARHLVHLGHPDVRVMTGGILGWIDHVDPTLPRY